jgi:hypothetical protein
MSVKEALYWNNEKRPVSGTQQAIIRSFDKTPQPEQVE